MIYSVVVFIVAVLRCLPNPIYHSSIFFRAAYAYRSNSVKVHIVILFKFSPIFFNYY